MIDQHTATWLAVKGKCDAEIALALTRLETAGLGLAETEHERGQIRAYRAILAMVKPPVSIDDKHPMDAGY
jgi:hypothetical protein